MLERFRDLIESSPDSMLTSNENCEIAILDSQAEYLLDCIRPELLSHWAAKSFSSPDIEVRGKTVLVIPAQDGWQIHNVSRGTNSEPSEIEVVELSNPAFCSHGRGCRRIALAGPALLPGKSPASRQRPVGYSHTPCLRDSSGVFAGRLADGRVNQKEFLLSGNKSYVFP